VSDTPAVVLTPKQRRAAREVARREVIAAERARIEAERAGSSPAPAPEPEPTSAPDAPAPLAPPAPAVELGQRSDADREGEAAVFLAGVLFPTLAFLASWFTPWRLDLERFTEAHAREDAKAWVPLMRRYVWLDRAVAFTTAPARIIRRLRELKVRKEHAA
jgi:hypothetical protein